MSNSLCRLLHMYCIDSEDPISRINSILSDLSCDDVLDDVRDFMIRFRHSYVNNDTNRIPSHFRDYDFTRQDRFWRGDVDFE